MKPFGNYCLMDCRAIDSKHVLVLTYIGRFFGRSESRKYVREICV
jgi:hypothetical protein